MSDSTQMEKLKQQRMVEHLTYEKTLGDVTTNLVESDYNTENLLYTESAQSMVVETDIEALANYSEIKAKQRTVNPADSSEFHSEQYQTGKRAIGFLNSKKSHRAMNKRKNKMKESAKRLNKVGSDARKLKENAEGMPLKERMESLEKLYDNVRMADRYFAEGIASNKKEENKLKDRAELNYTQNLYNMYKRELDKKSNNKDAFLTNKVESLYWELEQKKSSFERNYRFEDVTQHKLGEGEKLLDNLEEKAETEQALKEQSEESLKNAEKAYNENTRVDSIIKPPFLEFSSGSLNEYLYAKSKYADTKDDTIKYFKNIADKDMKEMAFLDQKFVYYRDEYSEKAKQINKDYKSLPGIERAKIVQSTPEFKHLSDTVREVMMSKLHLKLEIESSLSTVKNQYEMKNSLVNAHFIHEKKGFMALRNVEKLERRLNILKKHLSEYSTEGYDRFDLKKEKDDIEERIDKCEREIQNELHELKENYVKEKNIKDDNDVTNNEVITYYKNHYKLKDKNGAVKSLKEYDMEEEIAKRKELEEKTNRNLPLGTKLNPMTTTLGVWNETRIDDMRKYYFPANSDIVQKLRHNLSIGHKSSGASDINRNIEMCLRPVRFDDRGKVLKEFEKNDEFNRKFIESHTKTTLTDDTKNDDKIFQERLPSLIDIMDELISFDDKVFSIDYITKSQDNLAKYTHASSTYLTFHSNVLKDRINSKLKDYCENDPELKKKFEKAEAKLEVLKFQGALFEAELGHKLSLTGNFDLKPLPENEYLNQKSKVNNEYEKALKEYNDKFGGE